MKVYHWFIPNKKNKFHPAALRTTGLIIFLAIFLAIPLSYNIITARQFRVLGYATNVNINDLYNLGNQERTNVGLSALNLNSELNSAALAKANDMMADDYWAHVAPDGTTPWDFINGSGYQYTAAGENLAKDFNTSSGVISGWMGSQTHKENVLNSAYQDVGYAVVNGVLKGSETTLVVAMYGAKAQPTIATTTPVTETVTNQPTTTVASFDTNTVNQPTNTATPAETATPVATTTTTQEQPVVSNQQTSVTSVDNTTAGTTAVKTTAKEGSVEGASVSLPIKVYNSLNWGQKTSILLICTLILLFAMKHTAIWREQKRGLKHIWLRAHPLGQIAILTAVLVITIVSGTGAIL